MNVYRTFSVYCYSKSRSDLTDESIAGYMKPMSYVKFHTNQRKCIKNRREYEYFSFGNHRAWRKNLPSIILYRNFFCENAKTMCVEKRLTD